MNRLMKLLVMVFALSFALALAGSPAAAKETSKEQQRQDVRKMARLTLSKLYKVQPKAKTAIEKAAGYGVFSNFGMKIFLAGGGSGAGVVVNAATKKETFMKMVEVQAGLGFGVKKFRVIFVFENQKVLNDFVNSGWELGGQTTAAAQVSGEGAALAGAMAVAPGIWLYQLTEDGLALELTAKGTKYYKDDKLN